MIFFTSICSNYLPKAMALAESVKRHCKDAHFVLCLVEREAPEVATQSPYFDEVVLAKDAGWDNFDRFMFRHAIVEAATAVKAQFMLNLVEHHPDETKFVYLDPDVLVYSQFAELDAQLDEASIVLCPHLLRPGNIDMEISSLAHGCYNLGFLAVRRSRNAQDFLRWWAERLFQFCYDDMSRGIFTDQRWVDLAPCFFDVTVLKHHGYDFATWSLLNSDLCEVDGRYMVNGDPLRFIHFSGLDSGTIDKAIGWWLTDKNRDTFVKLYEDYKQLLDGHGQATLGKLPWTYANYVDGRKISGDARVAYRNWEMWEKVPEPFSSSNEEILSFAKSVQQDAVEGTEVSIAPMPETIDVTPSILDQVVYSVRTFGVGPTMLKAARRIGRRRAGGKR